MHDTAFLRSDELPGRTALGYVEMDGVWRSNVFHLPVCGTGDGGIYTTAADVAAFWLALYAGRIVSPDWVREMTRPRSDVPPKWRYGLGFWLPAPGRVQLEGSDAGVASAASTTPTSASRTPCSRTRPMGRGRSPASSPKSSEPG